MSAPAHPSDRAGWRLENTYARLPAVLHSAVTPAPVRAPGLVVLNCPLAAELGLDANALSGPDAAELFAGNRLPPGASPVAQAYAGHQYGRFTPLGDGRALLLGEQLTPRGERRDLHLKGSGPTPYSRRGDGRAALSPMLREYIVGEAMHALGIPTTRALAVAATGEEIWRHDGPQPGAVLTRVAASHLRVGTFEWAAAVAAQTRDPAPLRALADYAIARHYPALAAAENPALALLEAVVETQAGLIARWMAVGFVHGVMNTDNMTLSGETIDYGPCAFIDAYDPDAVYSSIDRHGRYAFGRQPDIARWNLARLAEALLPLLSPDETRAVDLANAALDRFAPGHARHALALFRAKLGLVGEETDDQALIDDLLGWMRRARADFTNTFAALAIADPAAPPAEIPVDAEFHAWHARWRSRLGRQTITAEESSRLRRTTSPAIIPRNHLVESALASAQTGDLSPLRDLVEALSRPCDHDGAPSRYRAPAPADFGPYRTYCGT